MKKQLLIIAFLSSLFVSSCASIPSSTVTLTQEVIKEADEMHQLNVVLVNRLFEERKQVINTFITTQYTPAVIANYEKLLPDSLDYKKELPNIIKSIIPVIDRKRDSLQSVLSAQQEQIITKLNSNYINYSEATTSLQNLINSIVKLKTIENEALSSIQSLTGNSVDVKKVENTIDSLLIKSGSIMGKLLDVDNAIKSN
ncbi:MAG: hypothetical protein ACI976_000069 [Aureispira sp.]|jgi:hypothetical protein